MGRSGVLRAAVLYCHGLGASSTSGIAVAAKNLVESRQLLFKSVQYRDAGSVTRVWSVDRWLEDVLKEIDHSDRPIILLGNSAGCVLRAALLRRETVIALILLSPGVGLCFQNYARTVFPHSISDLLAGKNVLHPVALNGAPALVNLQCLQRFVDTCVSNSMRSIPIHRPVRIIHGDEDKVLISERTVFYLQMTRKFEAIFDSLLDALSARSRTNIPPPPYASNF
uniref:Serine aminopeptidase S33 domain-containing protein n=1 Tax=Ascaris lumbricoides TaxID=6252 RepID=A0A9J2PVS3_ASCLU